jgi:hypothetical protein
MSSHREAPEISKDPVADSTDVYAFVSPDKPDTVTLVADYIPLEDPAGGPNFFEFGDDVRYRIHVDNDGDGLSNVIYEFAFTTRITNPNTFLYNTGPIATLDSANWNRKQFFSVTKIVRNKDKELSRTVLGKNLACPPCNIGPRSTPKYADLAKTAVYPLGTGGQVFAGQRLDPFWVDLGSIFDLGALRPVQNLHLIPLPADPLGRNALQNFNVHTLAVQVPITDLTRTGKKPTDAMDSGAVIGVWTSAARQKAAVRNDDGDHQSGPFVQVSRLGNPLFNEVIVPMAKKDRWNRMLPSSDSQFAKYVLHPELAALLPVLYPGVFPNLKAYTKDRVDLAAILLTGIPAGVIPGFQNFTGTTQADELRLNMAIPPAPSPNSLGLLGGDLAGFPNGRRLTDNIVSIELRAVAGATIPLVDSSFTPDAAAGILADGSTAPPTLNPFVFPYLATPTAGFDVQPMGATAPVA